MLRIISLLLLCGLAGGGLLAQPGIQLGGGPAVGWMLYRQGMNPADPASAFRYDRTYVSLLVPVEGELFWQINRLGLGLGYAHTLMFDEIMIAGDDRRGARNRYRVAPEGEKLRFDAVWFSASWHLKHRRKVELRPGIRLGTFRSNTIHPAWNRLGMPWMFAPGLDLSWTLAPGLSLWVKPQYVHLWRSDSPNSLTQEQIHTHSLDIRFGIRYQFPTTARL